VKVVASGCRTRSQFETVTRAARRFGCESDLRIVDASPGLPDGWVLVFMGEEKSFPHVFQVSPTGEVVVGAPSQEF
jgi:hypothetical protein